jgi:hypothetical protein
VHAGPGYAFGFGDEKNFHIIYPDESNPLLVGADFSYGNNDQAYTSLFGPVYGPQGNFAAFGSTTSLTGPSSGDSLFKMKMSGTFSEQYQDGQHYYFQGGPPMLGLGMSSGSWMGIEFYIDGTPRKSATYHAGSGAPGHSHDGWDPVIWDNTSPLAGHSWEVIILSYGNTGLLGFEGGIGTYMPQSEGTPIPGPGIAMACAVGLAGIKRRRRR